MLSDDLEKLKDSIQEHPLRAVHAAAVMVAAGPVSIPITLATYGIYKLIQAKKNK